MPTSPPSSESLRRLLADRSATIGVIGLGYVGLPLAVAIARADFRTVGFDIDPKCVAESRENVRRSRVSHLVEIKQDNIYHLDLSQASVITLYLLPEMNVQLIPQLEGMRPGCRIVSHQWDMQGVQPDRTIVMQATDHESRTHDHTIYLWTTPLKRDSTVPLRAPPRFGVSGQGPGFSPPDARGGQPTEAPPSGGQRKDQRTN